MNAHLDEQRLLLIDALCAAGRDGAADVVRFEEVIRADETRSVLEDLSASGELKVCEICASGGVHP